MLYRFPLLLMQGKQSISWNCLSYWSLAKWSKYSPGNLISHSHCCTHVQYFSHGRWAYFLFLVALRCCCMFSVCFPDGMFFIFNLCFAVWPVQNSHGKYRPPGLLVVTFWSSLHRSWPGIIISGGGGYLSVFTRFTIIFIYQFQAEKLAFFFFFFFF